MPELLRRIQEDPGLCCEDCPSDQVWPEGSCCDGCFDDKQNMWLVPYIGAGIVIAIIICILCRCYCRKREVNSARLLLQKFYDTEQDTEQTNGGFWTEHSNLDMAFQGDVEIIHDPNRVKNIPALKQMCEEKNYSAICVGSFPHAALKKFDYQLEAHHCAPPHGYTCTLHIYHPSADSNTKEVRCEKQEARLTWDESKRRAEEKGGSLLTLEKARKFLATNGSCYKGEDHWAACIGAHGERDWVQVGDWHFHRAGKSHLQECGGYPPWGDHAENTTYGMPTWNYVLLWSTSSQSTPQGSSQLLAGTSPGTATTSTPWDSFVGETLESYPNGNPGGPVETFRFEKCGNRGETYATVGSHSGRNEYTLDASLGNILVHKQHGMAVNARLDGGEFQWSHGYRSRLLGRGGGNSRAKNQGDGGGHPAALNADLNSTARNTNDVGKIRTLVAQGADLLSTNDAPWHHTPLHQACYHNRPDIVRVLIELLKEKGLLEKNLVMPSNPCGRGPTGLPIELARGGGHANVVEILERIIATDGRRSASTPKQSISSFSDIDLTLSSHPGLAIVPKWKDTRNAWGQWDYIDLGVGPANKCVKASYDGQFIATKQIHKKEMVFDVSMWRYDEGNHLVLVKGHTAQQETRKHGGGRDFTVNADGTISLKPAPHLVLGKCGGTLALVEKGSPDACVLANVEKTEEYKITKTKEKLSSSFADIDLTLSSHPGLAIVPKWTKTRNAWGEWDYIDLGVGPANNRVKASYDGQFIATTQIDKSEMVFDVSMWKFNEGNHLVLVKGHTSEHETRKFGGGRDFVVNPDGTVSPKPARHLLLGNRDGTLALVRKGSPDACVLANVEKTEEYKSIKAGEQAACGFTNIDLTLSSHPGLAIVPKWTDTRNAWGEWDYIDLGVGAASKCVKASYDGQFIATNQIHHTEMVFDVSMWRFHEGNHLVLVKGHTSQQETRKFGGGRDFVIHADGTISPTPAQHLLLGNCSGTLALVEKGSPHACVLANVKKTEEYNITQSGEEANGFTNIDLTLSSHPGLAIVPQWTDTRNAWGEWDYIDLGVGPANKCVKASYDGQFIATNQIHHTEMVFDVSMWKFHEGNHLVLVKGHTSQQETRKFGGGRDFVIHADGTISPKPARHLLLGNLNGKLALVGKGSPDACVLANVRKTEEYKIS